MASSSLTSETHHEAACNFDSGSRACLAAILVSPEASLLANALLFCASLSINQESVQDHLNSYSRYTIMSQPRRSSRKKRQTQLSFSPLPSSSPAASQYPEQIQQRAAAIRYDSDASPTKKRRIAIQSHHKPPSGTFGPRQQRIQIMIPSPSPSKTYEQLPTPAPSSQVRDEGKGMI